MLTRPLKDRIFNSKQAVFVPSGVSCRPMQYKCWTEERLYKAFEAVTKGGVSVRHAAEEYNVPKSTLHDRISGKVVFGSQSGPPKYLSNKEEEELVNFILGCSSIGFPRSRKEIIAIVQNVMLEKGHNITVTNGWWDSFRKRYPFLTLRSPEPLSHARAICSSSDVINKYFDLLEETLEQNDLTRKPCQIFNCDESGFPLDPSSPRVVVAKGEKHPYSVSSGVKTQITVLSCCNAGSYVIPPLIIFDRKAIKAEMTVGEVPGSMYGTSDSGWIDGDLFDLWFRHHFLTHAPPLRPLLLLLDGHSSHYTPSIINKAAQEGVIIFCLPPHSTHITQPLDKGCFASLKRCWQEECHRFTTDNPGKVVSRFSFSQVFHRAWTRGMTMHNVITGFRITGVFPVNRDAVLPSPPQLASPKLVSKELTEKTGVSFIPLYSPVVKKKQPHNFMTFSDDERVRFQRRYEEGYDLQCDEKYNEWVKMYHPSSSITPPQTPPSGSHISDSSQNYHCLSSLASIETLPITSTLSLEETTCTVSLPCSSILSKWIDKQPTIKMPRKDTKASARILTSEESIRIMEEKEKKKREIEVKKAERQQKRLEKQLEKGN